MEDNIAKLDSRNVRDTISYFPKQCLHAWEQNNYSPRDIPLKNILVIGMGGSALGPYILDSLRILKVPLVMSHEYTIPPWVGKETLVFAISYSGTTEETLSATEQALSIGAYVVGITAGNTLEKILKEKNAPVCTINTNDNPCGQPRYAAGSMMMHMLKVCIAEGLCTLSASGVESALEELTTWQEKFTDSKDIEKIYEEAKDLENKMPMLIHSEHLANVGRFIRNQMHETAKVLAITHDIPELNHHLMEGLEYPLDNMKNLRVLFFESNLYSERIGKRFAITKEVLRGQGISYKSIVIEGKTPLSQVLIGMLRGMYLAFALALLHEKDPSEVKWVNYFKQQLGN
jgi:glucose/mannose-6-phosphate isomerase